MRKCLGTATAVQVGMTSVPGAGPRVWNPDALVGASCFQESDILIYSCNQNHCKMLSFRLLRQPACQLVSRTPITSRSSVCRPSTRAFHASTPRQISFAEGALYLPHELMSLVHAAVPWYAAIPITAFITRGLLVAILGTRSRALMARYIGLNPLREALAFKKRDEVLKRGNFRTIKEGVIAAKKEIREVTSALDKRWNVSLTGQIAWTFAQLPIFIFMAEAIRQKCGARDGLFGMVVAAFKNEGTTMPNDAGDIAACVTPTPYFEPSLATEGMLWFQDLLVPDPTGALPFIASGIMFANIYTSRNTVESDKGRRWPGILRRSLLWVTLMIGPMCQHLPAALMLYWSSSTASVMLWNRWLDKKYPAPRGYTSCKRPLVMPPSPVPKGRKV
jgi:inner membrane protein COX18